MRHPDFALAASGLCIVAVSYGLARYAYGLFLPAFRAALDLSDAALAVIAAGSYAAYVVAAMVAVPLIARLGPRVSVALGGVAASGGMALVAVAQGPWTLALGVAVAGVSPALAYTPYAEIIPAQVPPDRQGTVYAFVNTGTSLGVALSGPLAILAGGSWRAAWALFAILALGATLWCWRVLPADPPRSTTGAGSQAGWPGLVWARGGERPRLFLAATLMGASASVYWAFSVDLVTGGGTGGETEPILLLGWALSPERFGQVFWTLVGVAGFAAATAGALVSRLGLRGTHALALSGLAVAIGGPAAMASPLAALASGLLFGASFVLATACFGLWSLRATDGAPAAAFGLTFLLMSAGQFAGPFIVGLLTETLGLPTLFGMAAAACALLLALLPRA